VRTHTTSRMTDEKMSRYCAVASRVFVLLSAVLLVVMPWTENVWHFDRFPCGGPDFELSVFLLVTIFGLVLALLQLGKKGVSFIFALQRLLSYALQRAATLTQQHFDRLAAAFHAPPLPSCTLDSYNHPIQV